MKTKFTIDDNYLLPMLANALSEINEWQSVIDFINLDEFTINHLMFTDYLTQGAPCINPYTVAPDQLPVTDTGRILIAKAIIKNIIINKAVTIGPFSNYPDNCRYPSLTFSVENNKVVIVAEIDASLLDQECYNVVFSTLKYLTVDDVISNIISNSYTQNVDPWYILLLTDQRQLDQSEVLTKEVHDPFKFTGARHQFPPETVVEHVNNITWLYHIDTGKYTRHSEVLKVAGYSADGKIVVAMLQPRSTNTWLGWRSVEPDELRSISEEVNLYTSVAAEMHNGTYKPFSNYALNYIHGRLIINNPLVFNNTKGFPVNITLTDQSVPEDLTYVGNVKMTSIGIYLDHRNDLWMVKLPSHFRTSLTEVAARPLTKDEDQYFYNEFNNYKENPSEQQNEDDNKCEN